MVKSKLDFSGIGIVEYFDSSVAGSDVSDIWNGYRV